MKLTKEKLMEIIESELGTDKSTTSDVRKSAIDTAKGQAASGIKDPERGLINNLVKKLTAAAADGNIVTGKALRLAKMLAAELDNLAGEQGGAENPEQKL